MQIVQVPAPAATRPRPVYGLLVSTLEMSDQWVRIPLADIAGKDAHDKRAAVLQAMKQAGIRVKTHIDTGHIYVCRFSADEGAL
jgi:hypothetical protein